MAAQSYAVASNVETRLFGTTTVTAINHTIVSGLCTQANEYIERKTKRPIGPDTTLTYTLDGFDALENGRLLIVPRGIRTLTTLETATTTGGSFTEVAAGDFFLRPAAYQLEPGWPFTEVWMSDIPSSSTTTPYFPPGYANVRLTGTFGWAAIPADLTEVAEVAVVRAFNGRQTGQHDTAGGEETGVAMISRLFDIRDLRTIEHYAWKPVYVIGSPY